MAADRIRRSRAIKADHVRDTKRRPTDKLIRQAMQEGELPHQFLLRIARGEGISHSRWEIDYDNDGCEIDRKLVTHVVYPDFPTRLEAAKSAAPYFAPRLMSQTVSAKGGDKVMQDVLRSIAERLPV
jgi:hypothetical protein